MFSKVLTFLQNLGKSLMLPIAVLPIAGLMLRLGQPDLLDIPFLAQSGDILFKNLPMLFAIGVAVGFSVDAAGAAALAGVVAYFTLTTAANAICTKLNFGSVDMGVLAGILSGIIGGTMYNRFYRLKLPMWLAFFSGKRFVPIVSALVALVLALVMAVIWPPIQDGINSIGNWMVGAGPLGAAVYGVLNRLLLSVGLHQILNTLCWFKFGTFADPATGALIEGDLHRFFAGDPVAGMFMTGFFPVMMFGLPAVALAFYLTSDKKRRPEVAGMVGSLVLTAFLTGITEPLEYTFMFLAPLLYVIHALFTGLSMAICELVGYKAGFTFSAGAFDLVLSWGKATKPYSILWIGPLFFALYFSLFYCVIRFFKLKTPGREDRSAEDVATVAAGSGEDQYERLAAGYIRALGGVENITRIDNCITRLRLELADSALVDEAALKSLGAAGVIRMGNRSIQVVVGSQVEFVANAMKKFSRTGGLPQESPATSCVSSAATATMVASAEMLEILAPVEGAVVALAEVPDPTFAGRMAGEGMAIRPRGNVFVAPISGTILSLPASGHAFVIRHDSGAEVLVHIGLETVALNGCGFRVMAGVGMRIQAGTPVIQVNWALVRDKIKSTISPVVVSRLPEGMRVVGELADGVEVKPGTPMMRVEK